MWKHNFLSGPAQIDRTHTSSGERIFYRLSLRSTSESLPTGVDLAESYEEKYAPTYGRFRLERISEVVEHFISYGDYTQAEGARRQIASRA